MKRAKPLCAYFSNRMVYPLVSKAELMSHVMRSGMIFPEARMAGDEELQKRAGDIFAELDVDQSGGLSKQELTDGLGLYAAKHEGARQALEATVWTAAEGTARILSGSQSAWNVGVWRDLAELHAIAALRLGDWDVDARVTPTRVTPGARRWR